MSQKARLIVSLCLFCVFANSTLAQRTRLSLIPGANSIQDMSPDGRFVVGGATDGGSYLFDRETNDFINLPSGGWANSVSDDGRRVLAGTLDNPEGGQHVMGLWKFGATSWSHLGRLTDPAASCGGISSGSELSGDGLVAVGGANRDGCNYTPVQMQTTDSIPLAGADADGDGIDDVLDINSTNGPDANSDGIDDNLIAAIVALPKPLADVANQPRKPTVVSQNGAVIAGFGQTSQRTPVVWEWDGEKSTGTMLDPAGGAGEVAGMRDDGSILLGTSAGPGSFSNEATKWTNVDGNWVRETVGAGGFNVFQSGTAVDIADNNTVIGRDQVGLVSTGWVLPAGNGDIEKLLTFALAGGAAVPEYVVVTPFDQDGDGIPDFEFTQEYQMEFTHPDSISADGRIIAGSARQLGVYAEAWILEVADNCDVDFDEVCGIDDIDAVVGAIADASEDLLYDIDGDGEVSLADRDRWLAEAGAANLANGSAYDIGDANLDGAVDVSDFNLWLAGNTLADTKWSRGDFDASGMTDELDFSLWNANRFGGGNAAAAAIPEPHAAILIVTLAIAGLPLVRRRKCEGL